jgi:beta-aspartyl-dipeptidase (metallo-type)
MLLLRNAHVHAPEDIGKQDLLVAGGRIVAMAPQLPLPPAAYGATVVDVGGDRLIPGLIDCHVHVTGGGGESGPSSRVPPIVLSRLTEAGITSVVGTLGTDGTTRTVASLVARTLGLRAEGLSAWCYTGSYEVPPLTLTGSVRSDIVFVDPIVGVGELAISDHRSSQPTFDELARIAADAHVAGMMSGKAGLLHLHLGDGPRGLDLVRRALDTLEIPARTFHPTHCNRQRRLWDEAMALAERGCTVDVTAFPVEDDDPGLSAADAIDDWLRTGLPADRLTCSSDGAGCLPVFDQDGQVCAMDIGRPALLTETLRAVLERGHSLSQTLPFFTSNVARLFRFQGKGRIAVGNDADLVVLGAAGEVREVWARGRHMLAEGRPVILGPFEPRPT